MICLRSALMLSLLLLPLVLQVCPAHAEEMTTLNGVWDFQPQQEYVQPKEFNAKIIVPSFWNHPETFKYPPQWRDLSAGWYRRTVDIPKDWKGQRIALRFDGIYMTGQIFFNGRHMANTWDAINPNLVEVTPFVKWGEANEIQVGVRSSVAESDELFKQLDPSKVSPDFRAGATVDAKAKTLVPTGSQRTFPHYNQRGLSRDVWLIRSEPVYADNTCIRTSVRKGEITVDYEVRNASDKPQKVTLSANVTPWKRDEVVLKFDSQTLEIPAGATKTIQLKKDWKDAKLWDPDHPDLYMLHTEIRQSGGAFTEKSNVRFGFRESWTEGRNIMFNGNVLHLRSDTAMLHGCIQLYDEEAFRELCRIYRKFNINAIRLMCHSSTLRMLEIMDEEGLMSISESALDGSPGDQALGDERFWKNAKEHLRKMVRMERNHPCIVAWSIDNEMGAFVQMQKNPPWDKMTELTRVVKETDPTRIAWHDGFAYGCMSAHKGPLAETDVEVLHYTGPEYWALYYNFPESSFWAKTMLEGDYFGKGPMGIGEYAMVPGTDLCETTGRGYRNCHQAPLLGNRETRWPNGALKWHWDLHWECVAYSLRGNRYSGLALCSPCTTVMHYLQQSGGRWTDIKAPERKFDYATPGIHMPIIDAPVEVPLLDLYNPKRPSFQMLDMILPVIQANDPLLSFPLELNSRFWSGAKVTKTFVTFNDMYRPSKLNLTVTLLDDAGKSLDEFRTPLDIAVGGKKEVAVTLNMPAVDKVTRARIRVRHVSDAGRQYEETYAVTINPPISVPKANLYDPVGDTSKKFADADVTVAAVESLASLPAGAKQIVIGEGCAAKLTKADLDALAKFAQDGGTVVVLAQRDIKAYAAAFGKWATLEDYLPNWPYDLRPGPIPTTIAHLPEAKDDLTAGMTSKDVQLWANQHTVAYYGMTMPKAKEVKPLVIANRTVQDEMRSLLSRVTVGKGQFYLCQLQLADNVKTEPTARMLLARMLSGK